MSGETILVIDDSKEIVAHLSERVLPAFGYKTVCTNNGKSGLQMIRDKKPDLVMLDYNLPEMTGLDVLQEMAQESISTPVILMTGYGSELSAIEAFRLGAKDYLIKPFTIEEVVETIERALAEKRLQHDKEELAEQIRRLKVEMSHQAQQMKTLFNIGKAITSLLSVEQVLERVLDAATYLTNAEESVIWLPEEPKQRLQVHTKLAKQTNKGNVKTIALTQSQVQMVLQMGQSIREANFMGDGLEIATGYFARSVLHVPLKLRGVTLGVLSVLNRQAPRSFSKRDEFLLSFLADYAAIALENARVFQAADQALANRLDELNALIEITRTVTSSLDLDEVVHLAIKQVHDSWHIEACSLWLLDEARQALRVLTNVGTPAEQLAHFFVPLGEGFVGHVAETGKLVYTNDVTNQPLHYRQVDKKTGFITRSLLCAPLVFRGKVIGVLQLLNKRNGDFDEADVEKAVAIAAAVAIALTNAILFKESEAHKQYKDDFVATISHDMRAPLSSINAFAADLSRAGELNEEQQSHVHHINRAADHMMGLVNGLLDLAKVNTQVGQTWQMCDVVQLVREVAHEFQGQALARQVAVKVVLPADVPQIEADAGQLRSAISNLLDNAIKYSDRNHQVEMVVRADERNVLVEVSDQGMGIPESEMPHIFEKFYRGKLVNGRRGAGLGLALVRSVAYAHGGNVWVESRHGEGSKFTLRLPRQHQP